MNSVVRQHGQNHKKYIFVTGGVISGIGKGTVAASLGRLLKSRGYNVTLQKFDAYLNVDAGTMSPFEHGEVFVTEDGAEVDLDLGHYERFIDADLTRNGNVTAGDVYMSVIEKERQGHYDGSNIQIVPHITNEIKERIENYTPEAEITIVEIGGTVGDIECMVYLEAIRQFSNEIGRQNSAFIHIVLLPYIQASGEQKTKPAQHSVKELLGLGVSPDFIVCRSERPLNEDSKNKIALYCNVPHDHVITNEDAESIYEVPLKLHDERLDEKILAKLGLEIRSPSLGEWHAIVSRLKNTGRKVSVALVGKYIDNRDAYYSVLEALRHSGAVFGAEVLITLVDSEKITPGNADALIGGADGILVPSGFGSRGVEGMIQAARYARERGIPYFGICLGMQAAAVEFARNVLGYADADLIECRPESPHLVINWVPELKESKKQNGKMRLGHYPCELAQNTIAYGCYKDAHISERHRHRHEFNGGYCEAFENAGAVIAGRSADGKFVEIIELARDMHPWFVGVQFNPEFKSRPNRPHPLFCGFMEAVVAYSDNPGARPREACDKPKTGGSAPHDGSGPRETGCNAPPDGSGPREACGVFGAYSKSTGAVSVTYNALLSLQHRGQESAGIAVLQDSAILCAKDAGLVSKVFYNESQLPADSRLAIGHVRYSTAETKSMINTQPCVAEYLKGRIASAHNGNLTNARELREKLKALGAAFATNSDSEVISSLIAYEALSCDRPEDAIVRAAAQFEGAFSIVLLSHEGKLAALRDGWGFKPLCLGKNGDGYAVSSESCALDCCGYEFVRDVLPGEMVIIGKDGLHSAGVVLERPIKGVCVFEYVYFARPDSIIDGQSVYGARVKMGELLAREHAVEADIVCGIPETGLDAAFGYGKASGIEVKSGFVRNSYIGRSFINPAQYKREAMVSLKLNPLKANIAGKRVVLVDDSMVRGTTFAKSIRSMRAAGAREIHVRISCPQFLHKCHFGTDIVNEEALIAHNMDADSICRMIGADSLGFISIEGLHEACRDVRIPLCDGCLTGAYPDGAAGDTL